jgi:hemolysin III
MPPFPLPPPRRAIAAREELANTLTHALGLLLGIAGLTVLVVASARHGRAIHVVSSAVFGSAVVLLYLASTLYHAARRMRVKRALRVLDHACIYLLIAGTYTPFCLAILGGAWGWSLFGVVWGIALFGVAYKLLFLGRFPRLSTITYLAMGWLGILAVKPTIEAVPAGGIAWLVGGGLAYTLGVPFYHWDLRIPFGHAIWHLFVLAGTGMHFVAVLGYAIPGSG